MLPETTHANAECTSLSQAHQFFWPAIQLLARHTFSRFRWASSVQCFWPDFSGRAINH